MGHFVVTEIELSFELKKSEILVAMRLAVHVRLDASVLQDDGQ